jgi:hypothetical protein
MKDEIQKVTLGTNEALRVTAEGEFIWHPEADAMIEEGDFTSSPAMRHILRALRKALAAPVQKGAIGAAYQKSPWDEKGISMPPPAALDLQAELDATNRQVEILSDALAESRRAVNALVALARADEREACAKVCDDIGEDLWSLYKGRAPYTGKEEGRADMHVQGKSDGADECAAAIRARGETK